GGSFKEEDFNREKRLFCELVEAEKNDKRQYARTRLESELFPEEPYGLADLGNIAGAEAMSKESLFAAWQNMLKYANIGINVIGANLPEDFLAEFRRNLENLCREPQELNYQSKQLQKAELREVYDREEITQGKLCIGLCAPSGKSAKERAAATMANDLLGGGTYSKLFSVVREKLHLCYYCASRISRLKGYMVIDSGVDFANAQKAKDEILNQLELLKSGDFTDQDMESSRKSLCNAVKTAQDTASVIDRWYSGRFLDEELISPEEYRSSVTALKREDVIKAASGIEPHTVYYMLPKEELK
ncbi:MAG: insulinase family protein, partial [Clostridia bacterium]|nr:insulinase family protein [Clostridia bacterium]